MKITEYNKNTALTEEHMFLIDGPDGTQTIQAKDAALEFGKLGGGDSAGLQYTIAPANAVNKEKADLILTGIPEDDLAAINGAIEMLHAARESTDIAIRIDFLGGIIDVGEKSDGSAIVIQYDNIHLYGNGVQITGMVYDSAYEETFSIMAIHGSRIILKKF